MVYPKRPDINLKSVVLGFILIMVIATQSGAGSLILLNGTVVDHDDIPVFLSGHSGKNLFDPGTLVFFYDHECGSCQDAMAYIREYERMIPQTEIEYHNLAIEKDNQKLFEDYTAKFNSDHISYPVVFYGDLALSGSRDIITYTKEIL